MKLQCTNCSCRCDILISYIQIHTMDGLPPVVHTTPNMKISSPYFMGSSILESYLHVFEGINICSYSVGQDSSCIIVILCEHPDIFRTRCTLCPYCYTRLSPGCESSTANIDVDSGEFYISIQTDSLPLTVPISTGKNLNLCRTVFS